MRRRVFLPAKGTQAAGSDADVSGIDVAIDVEVGLVAVHPLAHCVCHPANSQNVASAIKDQGVGSIKARAC